MLTSNCTSRLPDEYIIENSTLLAVSHSLKGCDITLKKLVIRIQVQYTGESIDHRKAVLQGICKFQLR